MHLIKKKKLLFDGELSRIYLASSSRYDEIILKEFKMSSLTPNHIDIVNKEAELLSTFFSPYIVQFYGEYDTKGNHCFLLEYCEGGSLDFKLHANIQDGGFFLEKDLIKWTFHVLNGLSYLHSNGVIHRDIEPENLLFKTVNHEVIPKITDFSFSYKFKSIVDEINSFIGKPLYMAPEIYIGEYYNRSVDIWSLGITLVELCNLKHPYDYETADLVYYHIISDNSPTIIDLYSPALKELILSMLNKDQLIRPHAKTLLSHKIFSGFEHIPYKKPSKFDITSFQPHSHSHSTHRITKRKLIRKNIKSIILETLDSLSIVPLDNNTNNNEINNNNNNIIPDVGCSSDISNSNNSNVYVPDRIKSKKRSLKSQRLSGNNTPSKSSPINFKTKPSSDTPNNNESLPPKSLSLNQSSYTMKNVSFEILKNSIFNRNKSRIKIKSKNKYTNKSNILEDIDSNLSVIEEDPLEFNINYQIESDILLDSFENESMNSNDSNYHTNYHNDHINSVHIRHSKRHLSSPSHIRKKSSKNNLNLESPKIFPSKHNKNNSTDDNPNVILFPSPMNNNHFILNDSNSSHQNSNYNYIHNNYECFSPVSTKSNDELSSGIENLNVSPNNMDYISSHNSWTFTLNMTPFQAITKKSSGLVPLKSSCDQSSVSLTVEEKSNDNYFKKQKHKTRTTSHPSRRNKKSNKGIIDDNNTKQSENSVSAPSKKKVNRSHSNPSNDFYIRK